LEILKPFFFSSAITFYIEHLKIKLQLSPSLEAFLLKSVRLSPSLVAFLFQISQKAWVVMLALTSEKQWRQNLPRPALSYLVGRAARRNKTQFLRHTTGRGSFSSASGPQLGFRMFLGKWLLGQCAG
jgi:hypothetical protein